MSQSTADPELDQDPKTKSPPKILPPYVVIIHNDNIHTFPYVISTLKKVFGYPEKKGLLLAIQIHETGKSIVWTGPKEVAELKRDQVRSAGPDIYSMIPVRSPLKVTIEPIHD